MRKDILTKLKSNSGASLMAALLFFIMCATVGSFVLAAATASSGRLAGLKRNEQAHYAVNSAAEVLSETICNKKVILKLTKSTIAGSSEDPTISFVNPLTSEELVPGNTLLADLVSRLYPMATLKSFETPVFPDYSAPETRKETTDIEISVGNDALKVNGKVTMYPNLNLLVELTQDDSSDTSKTEKITIRFIPVIETGEVIESHTMSETKDENDKREATYAKIFTVYWTNPVIVQGE